ncbi:SLAP domain-containing protein [Virgibacillus siamensis]|uniref:SLAP domain-containing protein n=1 Tax=Virgibacillus siamensis TaxID=480071 RepID=UPI00158C233C|nr:SLAP domain-containing protein [Virgibacillus siamensis]
MQTLQFHPAWDSTLSEKDRHTIKQSFELATLKPDKIIQFTPLWQAKNHRGNLLVTVLIHNIGEAEVTWNKEKIVLYTNSSKMAEHRFSLPFTCKSKTSTPWTFIFPQGHYEGDYEIPNGELFLKN